MLQTSELLSDGLLYQLLDLVVLARDIAIALPAMGNQAAAAVLEPAGGIAEIPSAFISQRIQRAVAKQAVEVLRIIGGVAGKVFAFAVGKELKVLCGCRCFHIWSPFVF